MLQFGTVWKVMILRSAAGYYIVPQGTVLYSLFDGSKCYSMIFYGTEWYSMVLYTTVCYEYYMYSIAWYCLVLCVFYLS